MIEVVNPNKGENGLPYVYLPSLVFEAYKVTLSAGKICTRKEMFDKKTLKDWGFILVEWFKGKEHSGEPSSGSADPSLLSHFFGN